MSSEEIKSIFGNQIRIRVMGILIRENQVLLVNHSGLNTEDELWLPPGGGVEVGERVEEALIREFHEEVGLRVQVGEFLGIGEFIASPLHAIELFFVVEQIGGKLQLGYDPEMKGGSILKEVRWMNIYELKKTPEKCLHWLLQDIETIDDLFAKRGFFNIGNNP